MSSEACIEGRYAKRQGLHGSNPPTHIPVRATRTIYNLLSQFSVTKKYIYILTRSVHRNLVKMGQT